MNYMNYKEASAEQLAWHFENNVTRAAISKQLTTYAEAGNLEIVEKIKAAKLLLKESKRLKKAESNITAI